MFSRNCSSAEPGLRVRGGARGTRLSRRRIRIPPAQRFDFREPSTVRPSRNTSLAPPAACRVSASSRWPRKPSACKMGVSTYMSYCGAQLFEAIGINSATIEKYFTGTPSRVQGIGVFEMAEEAIRMHVRAVRAAARRPDPRQRAGPAHPAADPRQHHATPGRKPRHRPGLAAAAAGRRARPCCSCGCATA